MQALNEQLDYERAQAETQKAELLAKVEAGNAEIAKV